MDWSLFRCGTAGHLTYAPGEPELRPYLLAAAGDRELWRCLRCGTFVPGPPDAAGPAAAAPAVRRGKEIRSEIVLRIFAVERVLRFLIFGALAFGVWEFKLSQLSLQQAFNRELPVLRTLFRGLGIDIDKSGLVGIVNHALHISPDLLRWVAIGLAAFAVIELVEGIGLWLAKRWGEYFATIVTALGLPYEVYDITSKFTWTRLVFMLINIALVAYLLLTRRLFGVRGGKAAYEARQRSESVIDEAIRAAAAAGPDRPAAEQAQPRHAAPARSPAAQAQPARAQPAPERPAAELPAADKTAGG